MGLLQVVVLLAIGAATPAIAGEVVPLLAATTVDLSPLAQGGITFLNTVLTGLAGWVSWYAVSWLSAKTGVDKATLNATLGTNLEKGLLRGIDLAYVVSMKAVQDNPNLKFQIDNPFLGIAANYVLSNYHDTLTHFGWDRDQLIRALILRAVPYLQKIGVPVDDTGNTVVTVQTTPAVTVTDAVAERAAKAEPLGAAASEVRQAAVNPI